MGENLSHKELVALVLQLSKKVKSLEKSIKIKDSIIQKQEYEIASLKAELVKYKNPKNSSNSSVPPSKDENRLRKTNSLRKKTGRKPGGQPGHQGHSWKMNENPDVIKECIPQYCNGCGCDLTHTPREFVSKKQLIDIPPIRPVITEYQVFSKKCKCGHKTTSSFPEGVHTPVNYGNNIQSIMAYLHSRHFISHNRMVEFMNHLFGLSISEGTVDNLLNRFQKKVLPYYQQIKQQISKSSTVGGDETGGHVNGEKHWFWTWVTQFMTLIVASDNRGKKTIDATFPNGFPDSTLVSDCWRSHLNTHAKNHQLCIAHLLRELIHLGQLYNCKWSEDFFDLLIKAIEMEKKMCVQDYYNPEFEPRKKTLQKFELLLEEYNENENTPKLNTFVNRMKKYKDYVFVFLFEPDVPPDNNAAERAVRNIKVKLKVSGQFKSKHGAERFAIIRSIIDTLIKNGVDILETLQFMANFAYAKY